jgi:hypothetical protein
LFAAPCLSFYFQSKEAMAQTIEQSKNSNDSINFSTYENPIFRIKFQYPTNWDKQDNTSSSVKNITLIDLVAFSLESKNNSDMTDIKPITLPEYANGTVSDLRQDFRVAESTTTLAELPAYK